MCKVPWLNPNARVQLISAARVVGISPGILPVIPIILKTRQWGSVYWILVAFYDKQALLLVSISQTPSSAGCLAISEKEEDFCILNLKKVNIINFILSRVKYLLLHIALICTDTFLCM